MKKTISFICTFLLCEAAIAAGETVASPVSYSANVMQMIMGLLAIIFMIFGLVWMIKKVGYKGYGSTEVIKIKSCLPLSTKEKLMLVEVGEEQLLIGVAPGGISHIKTLNKTIDDSNDNNNEPASSLFSERLKAMINHNTIK